MGKSNKLLLILASAMALSSQAEELVILHTNDTHSQIDPFADSDLGGVARRKVAIDSVRAANEHVLLIDAGDIVQGTLFFNLYKGEVEEKMMNALGYDMRILGNHEFDNGLERLAENLSMSDAELLCSNYDFRGTPLDGMFDPYEIVEIDGKRIAFMPINLQPKGMISPDNYEGMGYIDQFEAADHLAWYLHHIEHADAIIAITHIGYDDDVAIARNSRYIDAIIGGHSHTNVDPDNPKSPAHLVPNADGRNVLVAQNRKGGATIGEIRIDLDSLGTKLPQYKHIRIDSRLDDRVGPEIEEIVAPYRAAVEALKTTKVGKSAKFLDKDEPALLNFVSDVVMWRGKQIAPDAEVDLSIMNKGGLRNHLPKGDISEGDIIAMAPFFNRVVVIEIPGDSLIEAFETMARAGGNGVSANVKATFDPATRQCTEVLIDGKPIDPERTYRVATINYLALGGDYFHSLTDHKQVARSNNLLFDDIFSYFRTGPAKGKAINPSDTSRMKAAP